MTTLPDLLYVLLFAAVLPLYSHFVSWPAFQRGLQGDPVRARRRLWSGSIVSLWVLVAAGAAIWQFNERSWTTLGFAVPEGWRLWVSISLILLLIAYLVLSAASVARSAEARASARQQFENFTALMPHSRADVYRFGGVALTAGFCEEFLYRGYFIWVFAPWLGWWGAAGLSVVIFAFAHAYQGGGGVIRTGLVAVMFTLLVAILDSLWPAIVLHFVLDFGMGIIAWLALREVSDPGRGGTPIKEAA